MCALHPGRQRVFFRMVLLLWKAWALAKTPFSLQHIRKWLPRKSKCFVNTQPEYAHKLKIENMNQIFCSFVAMCIRPAFTPGGEGGYSKKFYTGRLRPEVQPLTLLYTVFSEKVPLSYTFYRKKVPLSYTFSLVRLINKSLKQEVFLSFFFT